MARIVVKSAHGPYELKPQKGTRRLCMCGLSKNQPFCDMSHKKTIDEKDGKLYTYDEKGNREEVCKDCGCKCDGKECDCGPKCCCCG